jgi:hypothetical protein
VERDAERAQALLDAGQHGGRPAAAGVRVDDE